jgi:hypothetical protein
MSQERCCTSTEALTTGRGHAGMDTFDEASDSAGTALRRIRVGGQDHVARKNAFDRFPGARQQHEIVMREKHDPSFELIESEASRRDAPKAEIHIPDAASALLGRVG